MKEKQTSSVAQDEHALARQQREELKRELAESYANLPRRRSARSRRITFVILGIIAIFGVTLSLLVFWPSASAGSVGGLPIGTDAPNFHLPVYGGGDIGQTIDLLALRGHPVILNFYSESCQPCLSEVPYLQRFFASHVAQHSFTLLGINQSDPQDDIRPFGIQYHVTYPLLFDAGGTINRVYNVTAIPLTYFIDSQGLVRYVVLQPLTPTTMQQGLAAVGLSLLA
ncbi:MAG TPA: TlpA disulfide reductase family protein [Ktedonobacteraceae bacterium]|nr:TlpA disulfide reductase family protein [Ktedonobacteraceae bacterium]